MAGQFLGTDDSIWKDAFSRFCAIARMRPWGWFTERHAFAIHPSGYPEPFFVHPSLGRYGCEHGLAIVYGWNGEALFDLLAMGAEKNHSDTRALEIPLVLCALRARDDLSQLEQLAADTFAPGADVGEQGVQPAFVSFVPGWMPWHMGRVEVQSTAAVLNQALGVMLRAEENPSLIEMQAPGTVWVRRQNQQSGKWEEGWTRLHRFAEMGAGRPLQVPDNLIAEVAALPETMPAVSIDFDVVPKLALLNPETVKIRGENGRIPLGYLFSIQRFGTVAGGAGGFPETGVFYPGSDIGSLFKFLPTVLLKHFAKAKARPREIVVSSERMRAILRPLQLHIPFKITFHANLPGYSKILTMVRNATESKIVSKTETEEGADGSAGED